MKHRIWGTILAVFGLAVAVPGIMSAMNSIQETSGRIDGTGIVALVRYYDLRWEILLMALGAVLLLTATALFLSPVRRRVAITADEAAVDHGALSATAEYPLFAGEASAPIIIPAPAPTIECYLTTRLVGATFADPGGVSRQSHLAAVAVGDVAVCRTEQHRYSPDTICVYTTNGHQLGYLDAAFVRTLRDRYPNRRIGVCVERVGGGDGLPYTCDLRVAVYRG